MSTEGVTELPPPDDDTLQLIDDTEWAVFVQFNRNIETTDALNDKVICRVPPHTLSEYQSHFKRIRDMCSGGQHSELSAGTAK